MTLAVACLLLQDWQWSGMTLHRDHLCPHEHSHRYCECPAAPYLSLSALELAPLATSGELAAVWVRHLIATGPPLICRECGCSEWDACPDDGSGQPCHPVSRDPPLCPACAPAVTMTLTAEPGVAPETLSALGRVAALAYEALRQGGV